MIGRALAVLVGLVAFVVALCAGVRWLWRNEVVPLFTYPVRHWSAIWPGLMFVGAGLVLLVAGYWVLRLWASLPDRLTIEQRRQLDSAMRRRDRRGDRIVSAAMFALIAWPVAALAGLIWRTWWPVLTLPVPLLALTCGNLLVGYVRRRRQVVDADLAAVPYREMEDVAHILYGLCCVSSHSPSSFEHAARVWLARGYLELPYSSRRIDDLDMHRLPAPYPHRDDGPKRSNGAAA